ncbi:MAG: polyprenyl synthetase family protein [Flavobacteriales bacterium]|nr:polyprenyl synthetase family protein [Flavobacteriales bacterium]
MSHLPLIEARIAEWAKELPQGNLYAPMAYLMGLPAKRVRPLLVLMACELFGGRAEDALDEALGIELFHNFTLMHDDIMDQAPLRRGQPTVHMKWDVNTAILSGDAMLVKAYQLMGKHPQVAAIFSEHALAVCEGQQLDMEYEQRGTVSVDEYRAMIRLKTAVLLSCALQVGATVAGASKQDAQRLGAFGEHLGLAFQLRDDLLDAFGDPAATGKQQGGDLRAGKKTFLLIRGLELGGAAGRDELRKELAKPAELRDVQRMLETLEVLGVRAEAERAVGTEERRALQALDGSAVEQERKQPLRQLAAQLMARNR